tara:strand:+ start:73 stop:1578 length:1506 start_codon:yes stop_codon:yes gene_type:complete
MEKPLMEDNSENFPIWSVSEISSAIKKAVEENLSWVRIRGEISGLKEYKSGLFFSLTDQNAKLEARCWRDTIVRLKHIPEDGMEVIVSGKVSVYAPHSKYNIIVQELELAGEGALLKLLEERKRKFSSEGLFNTELKKTLPFMPSVIGVVTSPRGAVIKDILHRVADRLPTNILVWPSAVQGQGAAGEVSSAIRGFNALDLGGSIPRPNLIIVARGGGSIEDLWAFNEEEVVRAVSESEIPIISAVGHETDTTLIDLVADWRAPTPSAAAEIAVPERRHLLSKLSERESRLFTSMANNIEAKNTFMLGLLRGLPDAQSILGGATQQLEEQFDSLNREVSRSFSDKNRAIMGLRVSHPHQVISFKSQIFDERCSRLSRQLPSVSIIEGYQALMKAHTNLIENFHLKAKNYIENLNNKQRLLDNLSYRKVLARGFAVIRNKESKPISSAKRIKPGSELLIEFKDGVIPANILDKNLSTVKNQKSPLKNKKNKNELNDKQGKLI